MPLRVSHEAIIHFLYYSTTSITPATVKENSRSLFNFDATVDWHQRHEFLKCMLDQ